MGGGSQTQNTSQTGSSSQNDLTSYINKAVSGQNLTGNAANTLGQVQAFDTAQMNQGLSPAVQQQALQQNQTQNQQSINNIMHQLGASSSNSGGLAEDLGKQAIMGNAQTASNLGAANQQAQQQGAQALQGVTAQLNPNQNYSNTSGGTGSASQSKGQSTGTTTQTSNPGFGSFLGQLLGAAGSAYGAGA